MRSSILTGNILKLITHPASFSEMPKLSPKLRKELRLASCLIGVGLFALPPAVYWVGRQVVGEYSNEGGLWALILNIWLGAITLNPMALLLVLSPYLIIQTLRVSRWARNKKHNKYQ
jgi:hypothetical protein